MLAKKLLIIAFALLSSLISTHSYGQTTPLPYYENFDTSANIRWTRYERGTVDAEDFPWYITVHNPYSAPFSMMHTCNTATANADNWSVGKNPYNFSSGGKIDSIRSWISSANLPAMGDTIGIYLLTGSTDPEMATAKTLLFDFRAANFEREQWIKNTDIIIPPTSGTSYIAFRYKTANNCINIFLDNMQLSGNAPTGVNTVFRAGNDFVVAPNPIISTLTIQSKENFEILNIYNLLGQKIHTQTYQPSTDISFLNQGTYLLELIDNSGRRGIQKIVKL